MRAFWLAAAFGAVGTAVREAIVRTPPKDLLLDIFPLFYAGIAPLLCCLNELLKSACGAHDDERTAHHGVQDERARLQIGRRVTSRVKRSLRGTLKAVLAKVRLQHGGLARYNRLRAAEDQQGHMEEP